MESQNWREEQVAGLVGGSMARPCGRGEGNSGRDPSNPLLPPLSSLAQGTQRLAAEALKTAIKTPLMDGTLGGVL